MDSQQKTSEKNRLFAERLRSRLARLNIQDNELAEKVGVSPGAIGNWKSGENAAKGKNLRKLAEVLDCDPSWLIGEAVAEMREQHPESDNKIWERRAKAAELKLHEVRMKLSAILNESDPARPRADDAEGERVAEEILDDEINPNRNRRQ